MASNNKRPALGKNLAEILKGASEINTSGSTELGLLPISKIKPNPDQPRKDFDEETIDELAESIRQVGVVSAITVRKISNDEYQIISGERRYRASLKAGLKAIPAYISTASEDTAKQMALVENLQREDLNAIEIALSYKSLMETQSLTQDKISQIVGKKRATVANYLRLLSLPAEIQIGLKEKKIEMAHARALLAIEDPTKQLEIYKKVIANGLSSKAVENMAKQEKNNGSTSSSTKTSANLDPRYTAACDRLKIRLNSDKISMSRSPKGKGKITISFDNDEELEKIIDELGIKD